MFVSPFEAKVLAFENEMGSAVGTDLVKKEMTRINGRIELMQHPTTEKVEYRASMKYKITWTPPTPDSQAPTLIRVKLSPYINGTAVKTELRKPSKASPAFTVKTTATRSSAE